MTESPFKTFVCGIGLGCMIGALALDTVGIYSGKFISPRLEVQQGYVAPANIRMRLKDQDFNGEKETILEVDEKPYLLMYDSENKPTLRPYEVIPARINTK